LERLESEYFGSLSRTFYLRRRNPGWQDTTRLRISFELAPFVKARHQLLAKNIEFGSKLKSHGKDCTLIAPHHSLVNVPSLYRYSFEVWKSKAFHKLRLTKPTITALKKVFAIEGVHKIMETGTSIIGRVSSILRRIRRYIIFSSLSSGFKCSSLTSRANGEVHYDNKLRGTKSYTAGISCNLSCQLCRSLLLSDPNSTTPQLRCWVISACHKGTNCAVGAEWLLIQKMGNVKSHVRSDWVFQNSIRTSCG